MSQAIAEMISSAEQARAQRKDRCTDEQIRAINAGETPNCANCGSKMQLRRSRFGLFYGCTQYPSCTGTHGAHPDGRPLGIPATDEVKRLRIRAHELLDARFGRKNYFTFLKKTLGISRDEAHVARLNKNQLKVIIATLEGNWDKIA